MPTNPTKNVRNRIRASVTFAAVAMLSCIPLLLVPCIPAPTAAAAAAPSASEAFEQNKRLGRGVNILGWDPAWRDLSKARFREEHLRLIHEAGFTGVRIVMYPFSDARRNDGKISAAWFATLDWAIDRALANHLTVDLDFHEYEAMSEDPVGRKDLFLSMWSQIAEHCRDRSDQVLFEVLNEPHGKLTPQLWNQLLADAHDLIRRSNPRRTLIIGPGQWNGIGELKDLQLPEDDRNIIVTVHYYSPMKFTHQGASWAGQTQTGVEWTGTLEERDAVTRDLNTAQGWAAAHNRPIFLGEFGAYDKADMDSRARWTSFVARQAEKRGWSWAYWQFSNDFVLYDIPNHRWVEPIRDALIPPPRG